MSKDRAVYDDRIEEIKKFDLDHSELILQICKTVGLGNFTIYSVLA